MSSVLLVAIPLALAGFALGFLAINLSQRRQGRRLVRGRAGRTRRPMVGGRKPPVQPAPVVGYAPRESGVVTSSETAGVGIEIPPKGFSTEDVRGLGVSLGPPTGSPTCPYCQQLISTADVVACPACHTAHHRACWESYKGCSMFNCAQAPVKSL